MKPWYQSKEDIPKGLEQFYTERDGRWVLQVEGMVPENELRETKERLNEFRTNNVSLSEKLKEFEGKRFLTDEEQEEFDSLKTRQQEIEDKNLINAGKIDELVHSRTERMRGDYENKISALQKRLEKTDSLANTYKSKLSDTLVESSVSRTLSDIGISPVKGALSDIVARARSTWQVNEDGQLVAVDANGNTMFGSKADEPLSMSEWAAGVTKEAPYLFLDNEGTGGDGGSGSAPKVQDGVIQIKRGDTRTYNKHIEDIASGKAVVVD